MKSIGVDLHKKTITVCVIVQDGRARKVVERRTFRCAEVEKIRAWFERQMPFEVGVEATASYEWFVKLVQPLAHDVKLAHPKKMRVIAESKNKSDNVDAFVIAEFLALGMIPEAYRPTPREREHRTLVRHRAYVQKRITSVKNKVRRIMSNDNADIAGLFSEEGRQYLASHRLSAADRLVVDSLLEELDQHQQRLRAADRNLSEFARQAPVAEREARAVLETMPCVGQVTIDVVLSELGNLRRFRSQKQVAAYAGLAPGERSSAGRKHQLGITKEGSPLLRWIMIQTAWRAVGKTRRWGLVYEQLRKRTGAKKAIVAVARRLLCVMASMLRSGQGYRMSSEALVPGARPLVKYRPAALRVVVGSPRAGLPRAETSKPINP